MIQTGFESKVKIQQIIDNQLPQYVVSENPNAVDFLKQYYISQEYQGGPVDITDNLDQYLKLDNLTPDVVVDNTTTVGITTTGATTINVSSTKGFPNEYGLLKIDDEVITYTGLTTNTFTGCIRGFCGITSYHQVLNQGDLVFSDTTAEEHSNDSQITNLSSLFLKEFYKKQKSTLTPGLEQVDFADGVNAGNFIKEARSLYESKGTEESYRILFNVLYGETPKIVNLEDYLLKPSSANFIRREIVIADVISGDPLKLVGQTLFKESDSDTNAAISEVEAFSRVGVALTENKQYFRISLFLGYDDSASTIQGDFTITPASKCLQTVAIGSSVISVDSTVGFGQTGNLISDNNTNIKYTSKSIDQFFGCTGIDSEIESTSVVTNDETYYGYEDGDVTKKVKLRLTGVLSKFEQVSKNITIDEGQIISVNNIGDLIENPTLNKTYKEIFANSWIYNTSVRYKLGSVSGTECISLGKVDRSSLKKDDQIEIVLRGTNNVVLGENGGVYVLNIVNGTDITISDSIAWSSTEEYDIRRRINYAGSTIVPLEFNKIISDTQNLYVGNGNTAYVASNSLPSAAISGVTTSFVNTIDLNIQSLVSTGLTQYNSLTEKYGIISFGSSVPFIDGDEVYYNVSSGISTVEPVTYAGLETGRYYVGLVTTNPKQMKLYNSRSFIGDQDNIDLSISSGIGTTVTSHKFTLFSQKSNVIGPQKLLKKFSLDSTINRGTQVKTPTGSIGMMIDGVEITNYKSNDKIYYGPLKTVNVLNGGSDYDVIDLPKLEVSAGSGNTALIQPVISGKISKVYVDPQGFNINSVVSIGVTGGNSTAVLKTLVTKKARVVDFDGRATTNSGGINTSTGYLTFLDDHYFQNHQQVIYQSNGNGGIGIGSFVGDAYLVNSSSYFVNVINNTTVQLYNSRSDSIVGINTVGFAATNLSGVHKFATLPSQKSVTGVEVVESGNFTNRKLIVKPSGISTNYDSITFNNHGFSEGEVVEYSTTGNAISGLTTTNQYKVIKIDEHSFRLANAGLGATIASNYNSGKYVSLGSTGTGYHNFAYPPIIVSLQYIPLGFGTDTQTVESINLTPTVRGEIIDAYLYETGTGYGSSVLNFEKKPIISIKNGKDGQLNPLIVNGRVEAVNLQYGGSEYFSIPDLVITDGSGKGSGAQLRPVITNNKISSVKIVNPGIGYSSIDTTINVVSAGKNALLDVSIRPLSIDINKKYRTSELLLDTGSNLQYSIGGLTEDYIESFGENDTKVSDIIGWAYDGNPIYGPYGYSDPNTDLSVRRMVSGYEIDTSNIIDRPSLNDFAAGFFVEDYKFTNSGDLDQNNGRFGKTPEFPDGIYAYFATLDTNNDPQFPYFVGDAYRSVPLDQNMDQSFDFSQSDLIRNTFPYKVADPNADNDFIIETNEISRQKSIIESVTSGSVEKLDIVSAGDNYKIKDSLTFDSITAGGSGVIAQVSSLKGKDIVNVSTAVSTFSNVVFTWEDENKVKVNISPSHDWENNDNIVISGFSTQLSELNGQHLVGLTTSLASLTYPLESSTVGLTTEIWVSRIPSTVSVGSSLKIGTETLRLLNIYEESNLLKVERGVTGIAHTATSIVSYVPDSFDIGNIGKNVKYFESSANKKTYFNPRQDVGFGTVSGISSTMTFEFGGVDITRDILTQRIYLNNHPFNNNQQVTFNRDGNTSISISTSPTGGKFDLPSIVYISDQGKNTIGIKTGIGTMFSEVYFRDSSGDDKDNYSLESRYPQVRGKVEKIISTVSISTSHNLKRDDNITLNVKPDLSVGIGNSTAINLQKQFDTGYLLVNPIGFNSTGINTITDQINLTSHNLKTGDKVSYYGDLLPSGISSQSYYVYKVDDDSIKLSETYIDSQKNPPATISVGSTGGVSQYLALVNPQLEIIRNNNIVFNLSHSSLKDYNFKLYYDNEFKNEFVSTAGTTFNVVGFGTVGVSSEATSTVNYDNLLPEKLYYNTEKSGSISTSDISVSNYSEITFVNSSYNGSYDIIGIGNTTFDISLEKVPEKLSYNLSECSSLDYTTKSVTATGGISGINILSGGINYKKLPNYVGSSSTQGVGAYVVAKSDSIGNSNKVRILNEGFEYSSDKTLQPQSYISPLIVTENSNTIGIITVTDGGSDYLIPPLIDVVDSISREKIDNGLLEVKLNNTTISSIETLVAPNGLPDSGVELFAVNNSNGVGINTIYSDSTSSFTCYITAPVLGFSTIPFAVNDEVYVEGVVSVVGAGGSGFNSADLGYRFGKVTNYVEAITGSQDAVTIDFTGVTTNTGIAVTNQSSVSVLVNKKDYPTFVVTTQPSQFNIGEKLLSDNIERDLVITSSENDFIKVDGSYRLSVGEVITGKDSGTTGTINQVNENKGRFLVDYMVKKDIGWNDNIGALNLDTQVTPNNDYYQNMSYAVQSSRTFDELRSPVTSLLHTSGLKNFANTGITSISTVGIGSSSFVSSIQDVIEDNRVDTVYNYDFAFDLGVSIGSSTLSAGDLGVNDRSRFIKFGSKRLSPYTDLNSNEVLVIDNIKDQFSNLAGDPSPYLNILKIDSNVSFKNILLRISNPTTTDVQTNDLIILNNGTTSVLLQRDELEDEERIGSFGIIKDAQGDSYLRFTPLPNADDYDYDLKAIESDFTSNNGIGTNSLGFIDLTGSIGVATVDSVAGVTTTTIVSAASTLVNSFFVKNQVTNKSTGEMNYVETYLTHDGTDTFIAEYYTDTHSQRDGYSDTLMGSWKGDLSGSTFSLKYENDSSDEIEYKSNIVGFGSTSFGTDIYRFRSTNQPEGNERTAIYQSNFGVGIGTTTVVSLNKNSFNASHSVVEVSVGSTRAIHQITMNHDTTDVYTQSGPILSNAGDIEVDTRLGIGTFEGVYDSADFVLKFHPEPEFIGDNIQVSSFNKILYTLVDSVNIPNDLTYGGVVDSVNVYYYNALSGNRVDRTSFTLTNDNTPIFAKTFDPSISSIIDIGSGGNTFNIDNHFFRTNEELIYTPGSTFVGVGSTPMLYQSSTGAIDELPSSVFAIRTDADQFQISTTRGGSAVTFIGVGTGNAHQFEMAKSNTKSIITIDNVIQSPLAYVPLSYSLSHNTDDTGTGISTTRTILSISGISSLTSKDTIKIDNEYMKVLNVGVGTTTVGPITGIGTENLIEVERGFVGSAATNHSNSSTINIYRGSFKIVGEKIHFTDAPKGNPQVIKTPSNLNYATSDFNGRVYFRNNYDTNQIYDDISDQFTGIGQTFTLTNSGINTVGLGTSGGNGLVLIGNIFQNPTAENNPNNNFQIIESSGISSVRFTGIRTSLEDPVIINESDVNQNELPRGGLIVSLGSTPGLGYAPAQGAIVYAEKDSEGVINRIVGVATTGPALSITTSTYNNLTGLLEVTTSEEHNFEAGIVNQVRMVGLEFTCGGTFNVYDADYNPSTGDLQLTIGDHYLHIGQNIQIKTSSLRFTCAKDGHATDHDYPRVSDPIAGISTPITATTNSTVTIGVGTAVDPTAGIHTFVSQVISDAVMVKSGYSGITTYFFPSNPSVGIGSTTVVFNIIGTGATNKFTTNVGVNSIPHTYVQGGSVMPWYGNATFGSGYRGSSVAIAVTDVSYTHKFVGAISTTLYANSWVGAAFTAQSASYTPSSGNLVLTIPNHGLTTADTVGIRTGSLTFTCSKDDYATEHTYPRATDPVAGLMTAITAYTSDTLTANVGANQGSGANVTATVGIGGTLIFTIGAGGTDYVNPYFNIPSASYSDLEVTGVSRLGIGATTETGTGLLLNVEIGSGSTVGSSSTYFGVTHWEIARKGYGFKKGDVLAPVGLVTASGLASPLSEFQMTVLDTYSDTFGAWQFGQFDYIDSIKDLQNGSRKRFELRYDGELLSFEVSDATSFRKVNLSNCLLIIINGVIQEPEFAYKFEGGSSFVFTEAPNAADDVTIFFYRGSSESDSSLVSNIYPSIKVGDDVQLDRILNARFNQESRIVESLRTSDTIESNLYGGPGITSEQKSLNWSKQKVDKVINGRIISKSRDSLEPLIFPTAKIIGKLSLTDNEIFVDNVDLFNEENKITGSTPAQGRVVGNTNRVAAALTATVSDTGTISSINIVDGGSGYTSATISVGIPTVGIGTFLQSDGTVGIGSTAAVSATLTDGVITGITTTNVGWGYTQSAVPSVLASFPPFDSELVENITVVKGFSGIVTGIGTTTGNGTSLALKFNLYKNSTGYSDLNINYPIYISNTQIGTGVTSIYDANDRVVGIGTTFLDNIYNVSFEPWDDGANAGVITCNVIDSPQIVGLTSTGSSMDAVGRFSWGRLSGSLTRNNPVAIAVTGLTVDSGLTTFPSIQRRGIGLRDTGALDKFYS
tara:strand:- start:10224 stop:23180 length:12957 start_codon:yes stop_codon:yes gene_type:complete